MKKTETVIGKTLACIVLLVALCIHFFIAELPSALIASLIGFSALLFFLCVMGDRKRRQEGEDVSQNK